MCIVPASCLSRSDLNRLSNNICVRERRRTRHGDIQNRRAVAAINRSLAGVGEIQQPLVPAGGIGGF
jgi:hypothetical protein